MKKKALRKDFYMEIKNSLGRFLSIFFIVAIGVAFFSGIRAAEPDMRLTGDEYFDRQNLMDIQVVSTLGLTEDDIVALKQIEGIQKVEAGYSADAICEVEDSQKVVHLFSALPDMNQIVVSEGRMPEKKGECLVDADFLENSGYKVGDQISFASGTADDIKETLTTDTFTIVGSGSSPSYISIYRGSSTIGTGTVNGFAVVTDSSFDMEVYTEIYATVEGAKELTAFTDAYDEKVEEVTDRIEEIRKEREEARTKEVVGDASKELAEAREKLADAKKEAEEKLSDARAEIDDGKAKLSDAKNQLADGRQEIANNKAMLRGKQAELDESQAQLDESQTQVDAGWAELKQKQAELDASRAELDAQAQSGYASAEQQAIEQVESTPQYQQLVEAKERLTSGVAQAEAGLAQAAGMGADEATIVGLKAQLEGLQTQLAEVDAGLEQMEAAKQQAMQAARDMVDQTIADAQKQMNDGQDQIDAATEELNAAQLQINDGQQQINDGQAQINDGWSQIEAAEGELASGEAEIAENEQKLADAETEYADGKKEADEKIEDGEKKLQDAQNEVDKIKNAKWYINDRSALNEYSGYGENADRMRNIGKVFPAIFFLVAALISLTTMTRMVEEQRTQIGTLKALGYGGRSIAAKYLGYAFLATMGGCITGVLIGEKILPAIIIIAYRIMYPHMDTLDIPYNLHYAVMASAMAVTCTLGATIFSCYKELKETAAALMRPPAPKKGKRVFLERIPLIWKRLSFSWKATVRNLMRYKKRFFMTIFGIGGCTGLLLVGFGLKDSIFDIAKIQYNEVQLFEGTLIMEDNATNSEKTELMDFMNNNAKVDGAEEILLQTVTIGKGKLTKDVFLCVPENVKQMKNFVVFKNRVSGEEYELDDNEVILTEKMAKTLDVKAGDAIYLKDDNQGEVEMKISAVCENYMSHYLYMSPALYEKLLKQKPDYNAVYYKVHDPSEAELAEDANAQKKQMEELGEEALLQPGALSVSYTSDIEGQLDDMLGSLNIVLVVLVVSAGMLAFVVLFNLNNINITERRRELATLRVLGFYNVEVAKYVYRENVILTLIGSGVGLVIGRLLHRFLIVTVEIDTAMFGRNVDFSSYIFSILITIGFSMFVNWVMYFKLKRIDMVESLKSVE